jgi:hypothetical protein
LLDVRCQERSSSTAGEEHRFVDNVGIEVEVVIENRFIVEDEVTASRDEDDRLLLRHVEDRLRVVDEGLLIEQRPVVEDRFLMDCVLRVEDELLIVGGELHVEDGAAAHGGEVAGIRSCALLGLRNTTLGPGLGELDPGSSGSVRDRLGVERGSIVEDVGVGVEVRSVIEVYVEVGVAGVLRRTLLGRCNTQLQLGAMPDNHRLQSRLHHPQCIQ